MNLKSLPPQYATGGKKVKVEEPQPDSGFSICGALESTTVLVDMIKLQSSFINFSLRAE